MKSQLEVKEDAKHQGDAPVGRTSQHVERGATRQGCPQRQAQREHLDGNVPYFHNLLDERIGEKEEERTSRPGSEHLGGAACSTGVQRRTTTIS